jgi:NAD-dependent protein deacetylase/lipoamidase
LDKLIKEAAEKIKNSQYTIAFTGSGISVESGIPSFRGENGIWSKYDPNSLELDYFYANPKESWLVIKEIFYDYFGVAKFNPAHDVLAKMEKKGLLECIITQNIDNLHQEAGNTIVHEFHGNSKKLVCTKCNAHFGVEEETFQKLPPKCKKCDGLLKPDFIFFGEQIPSAAYSASIAAAQKAEVCLVVGTTGEVMPANHMPVLAKQNGATIIEINPERSKLTDSITDIWLKGKASEVLEKLFAQL